ncbi:hypothetical protein [Amycolatopsis nigrescens]|uniref:hypothetical protein n=1 Tax=Amycolatopsis nigrescens TaxID=381445 RepID=UPI0003A775D0|nr:hypothetical protein [Amycolatopsis nigrescens]
MEQDGHRLLAPLRDVETATGGGVDLASAIRAGRRRRRGRSLAAVAMVVLITAGVTVFAGWTRNPADLPVAAAPGEFDVLTRELRVGSAAGFTPYAYQNTRFRQVVQLKRAGTADPATPAATVTLFPRGGLTETRGEAAPEVYGRSAVWLDPAEPGRVELGWQWGDGAWAVANVPATGDDPRTQAYRVAESVTTGVSDPVVVPFELPLPAGAPLAGVDQRYGASDRQPSTRLRYDERGAASDAISVGIRPADPGMTANTEINGRLSKVDDTSATILDLGGGVAAYASVDRPGRAPAALLRDLAASVRLN